MTKKVRDTLTPSLDKIIRQLDTVPKQAFDFWVSVTPKSDGNARRKTKLVGTTIEANYPYAQVLDQGSSPQAPNGMSKPTLEHVERLTQRILRK